MGLAMADCASRFAGKALWRWHMATAAVLGAGIWAVHFIGIAASASILPSQYSLAGVLSSLAVALAGSFGALVLAHRRERDLATSAAAGSLLAISVIAVPLLTMRGPGWTANISYHLPSIFGSAVLAVTGCWAAFRLNSSISGAKGPMAAAKSAGAVLLGLTVVATHYAATNSMTFIEIYRPRREGARYPLHC
jgi:NO-binding membrane sensor protein with MHYT domain